MSCRDSTRLCSIIHYNILAKKWINLKSVHSQNCLYLLSYNWFYFFFSCPLCKHKKDFISIYLMRANINSFKIRIQAIFYNPFIHGKMLKVLSQIQMDEGFVGQSA